MVTASLQSYRPLFCEKVGARLGVSVPLPLPLPLAPALAEGVREAREEEVGLGLTHAPPEEEVDMEAVEEVEAEAPGDTVPRTAK